MPTHVDFIGEVQQGRHRLTLTGEGTRHAWSSAATAVAERAKDHRYWSAWDPADHVEVVGVEADEGRAVVYFAGTLALWRALATAKVGIPAIDAAARSLHAEGGRLDRAICESRPLHAPSHEQIVGTSSWPWPVRGARGEVISVRPVGKITSTQMDILATMLMAGVHAVADRYGEGRSVAVVADEGVRLVESVPRSACLQLVHVWAQVCWVELESIELG